MGFLDKLKLGLEKTRKNFTDKIEQIVTGHAKIDEELIEDLEAVLLSADVGVRTTARLITAIRQGIKDKAINTPEDLKPFLQQKIREILSEGLSEFQIKAKPTVIMVVGVNGVGKTTTIGKLGNYYIEQGYKVLLAASDTFRAAAIEQLEIWGERMQAEVIKQKEGSDPAAVAYDALQAAKSRKSDILIIDTAGRLHTKSNLMEELKKIRRVISRELPEAPNKTLLVLDAATGQNAVNQAKIFCETAGVDGLVLTKLDGTAKGGVVLGIKSELGLPVEWIGVGEGIDDLRPFIAEDFAAALFGDK